MRWIPVTEPTKFTSRSVVRFIHTKLVLHEANLFLEKYPHRSNTLEYLDESESSPALLIKALKEIQEQIRSIADKETYDFNKCVHHAHIGDIHNCIETIKSHSESIQTSEEKEYREVIDDFQQDEYCKDIIAMVEYQPSILHQIAGIKELFIITKRDGNE